MKYKLIKEFPTSPKLGYISSPKIESDHYWMGSFFDPKNYPEFWEEIVEKGWKVLTIRTIFVVDSLKIEIFKIKRLSDNTVFSIGDRVKMVNHAKNSPPEKINKIEVVDSILRIFTKTFHLNGIALENVVKYEKLFTTEDGVDIYEGDDYYSTYDEKYHQINWRWEIYDVKNIQKSDTRLNLDSEHCHRFSTKKIAEKWVEMNKPKYSQKEVNEFYVHWIMNQILKELPK